MNMSDFRIVNDFDRPCEKLIARLRPDGKLDYVHPEICRNKHYKGMDASESVPVEDFGVTLCVRGDVLEGALERDSVVKYKDGRVRRWQGDGAFWFPLPKQENGTYVGTAKAEPEDVHRFVAYQIAGGDTLGELT